MVRPLSPETSPQLRPRICSAQEPSQTFQDGPRGPRQGPKSAQKAPNTAQQRSRRAPIRAPEAEPELTERARPPETAGRAPTGFQEAPGAPEGAQRPPPLGIKRPLRGSKHYKRPPRCFPKDQTTSQKALQERPRKASKQTRVFRRFVVPHVQTI